jgi:polyhydroxybutyrate depolymerase
MKSFLKWAGGLLSVVVIAVIGLGWWYVLPDIIEAPLLPGKLETRSINHNGFMRSWVEYIPSKKATRPALVVLLHGSRGDAEQMLKFTSYGFNVLAENHSFIAVYPNGYERHWNDCRGSAKYAANRENIDDVGFFRSMIDEMEKIHSVDRANVYVIGMSNGGQMAYRIGYEAPDLVAAIVAIAANLPIKENIDCQQTNKPVATLIINGTKDAINPYEGGIVKILGDTSRGSVMSAHESAAYWAKIAGHVKTGQRVVWPDRDPDDGTSVISTSWSELGKRPVKLISISGGGHTVPHTVSRLPRILGTTSHEFDAAEVIWAFFDEAGKLSHDPIVTKLPNKANSADAKSRAAD